VPGRVFDHASALNAPFWGGQNVNAAESLNDSVSATRFATFIGGLTLAEMTDNFTWYNDRFGELLTNSSSTLDPVAARRVFKILLALSLLIARNDKQRQKALLETSLLKALTNGRPQDNITNMVLCELSYLDQFLGTFPLRESLYDSISGLLAEFPDSSAFIDYVEGWQLLKLIRQNLAEPAQKDRTFEIFLVGSVKGGVGKSVAAMALAQYLLDRDARVVLIDLDASGPTVQYNFNVPEVGRALSLKPRRSAGAPKWPYPTLADFILDPSMDGEPDLDRILLEVSGYDQKRFSVALIPDSPTITGIEITAKYFNSLEWPKILIPLNRLLHHIREKGYDRVILDLGPGLFGTNGAVFSSLMAKYRTSLVLMSSPRSFDIASSLYDGFWLGAETSLRWERPILQLLNFWPRELGSIHEEFKTLTDKYYYSIFNKDFAIGEPPTNVQTSSGMHILFWRLRSYLYHLALSERGSSPILIEPLHYDQDVREVVRDSTDLGQMDLKRLCNVLWYKEDFVSAIHKWLTP
jgi:hypothetical protein